MRRELQSGCDWVARNPANHSAPNLLRAPNRNYLVPALPTYLPLGTTECSRREDVNHHNYSLDQEKHQYTNEISGLGINIQQEGISGNGDQTDGSLRNALTSGEEFSSSFLGK